MEINPKNQEISNPPKVNLQERMDTFSNELARITNDVLSSGAPIVTIVSILEMTKIQIAVDHINERRQKALIQQAARMAEQSAQKKEK